MKSGAPGRAPGRPALPSSQTGRRLAVRRACSPVARPASGSLGAGADAAAPARVELTSDVPAMRVHGGGGGRPRLTRRRRPGSRLRGGERDRALPRPASRTRVPFPRHHAPARGASACSVGGSSARGTCVRKARVAVGRNGGRDRAPIRPRFGSVPRKIRGRNCNASCKGPQRLGPARPSARPAPEVRPTTSRRRVFTSAARVGLESRRTCPHGPGGPSAMNAPALSWRRSPPPPARSRRSPRSHRPTTRARTTTTATTPASRSSPATVARPATCPSTRSRPTSSRSGSAPTTSSRTSSRPRTAYLVARHEP